MRRFQLADEGEPVDARQFDVHERNPRLALRKRLSCKLSGHRGADDFDLRESAEELQQSLQERRLILDDEERDSLGHQAAPAFARRLNSPSAEYAAYLNA